MGFRELVRGQVPWSDLEDVARELQSRYDVEDVRVEFLDADNWLSTPMVVNQRWFVKVVSRQNAVVQSLFTTGRNLGAVTSGTDSFFEASADPVDMAEREFDATARMRSIGVPAPEPVEVLEVNGFGVLMLEYLPDFRTLDDLETGEVEAYAEEVFGTLAELHEHGLAHGDLRGENVLLADGAIYFIDATSVSDARVDKARGYDLACGVAMLAPRIGAAATVEAALSAYDTEDLLDAREFLDFVNMRPDHDFDAPAARGEIEKAAS